MIITAIVTIIAAYLLGSINFAIIFSKIFLKRDIRKMGSGNAGATNILRSAGVLPGVLTFVCDALKGLISCWLGSYTFDFIHTETGSLWSVAIYGAYICGLACMLGHIFPIFFGFRGGKGVAVSVGIFAICSPFAIIAGLVTFTVTVLISRYVSLASLIATVVVVIGSVIFHNDTAAVLPQFILALCMGILVFWKHSENIRKLLSGTERKIVKEKR